LLANSEAVVWRDGKAEALPSLGGDRAIAVGINNNGDVVGSSAIVSGESTSHAALWRNGEAIDLGTLGGTFSFALKVNEPGQVIGSSSVEGNAGQAPFVWEDGEMTALSVRDGFNGGANGINDDGVVVGSIYRTVDTTNGINESFAVKWTDGERERLASLIDDGQGNSAAVNSNGDIVGWSALSDQGMLDPAAVIWEGSEVSDLNTLIPADSGYRLLMSTSINDNGQIVTIASTDADAFQHGVVLNPVDESASRIGTSFHRAPAAALRD
jgi:probable HAF family extracellular repeat protein